MDCADGFLSYGMYISFTFEKKSQQQKHISTVIKIKRKLRDLVTRKQRRGTTLSDVLLE